MQLLQHLSDACFLVTTVCTVLIKTEGAWEWQQVSLMSKL